MNVLRIELIREIEDVREYKVVYEESNVFTIKMNGNRMQYDEYDVENIPEEVVNFAIDWIRDELY